MSKAALVEEIKNLQRRDPESKQAWWEFCDAQLGGARDPNRHDESQLLRFLGRDGASGGGGGAARSGTRNSGGGFMHHGAGGFIGGAAAYGPASAAIPLASPINGPGGKHLYAASLPPLQPPQLSSEDLVAFVKTGQKTSTRWKLAWQAFCNAQGSHYYDPARCESSQIQEFIEYCADCVLYHVQPESTPVHGGTGDGTKNSQKRHAGEFQSAVQHHSGKQPLNKRARNATVSDPVKADLVERIKEFQRRDVASKELWWAFTDNHHDGTHDPARLEGHVLEEFLAMNT